MPRTAMRLVLTSTLIAGALALGATRSSAQQNMTLLGHLHQHGAYASCWGYTAPDGTELAIIGTNDGAAIIDATDPTHPVEVAHIPGPSSIWREMKTYGQYAYIVTEGAGGGLKIVNLTDPHHPVLSTTYLGAFSTCHTIWIDTEHGLAYCNGTDNGLRILSLANPTAPTLVATWNDFYVHDSYVRDGRCYAAAVYDGFMSILDVSNLPAITELGRITTPNGATHNTWLTADGHYCLTTDETSGGHIGIYNVQNPASPTLVSQFIHPTDPASSVHNVTVLGNLVPTAWYTNGVEVIDVSNPLAPQRVGWYDTFPGGGLYDGVWGVYPYAANGTIYASDMTTGLYIFRYSPSTLQGTVRDGTSSGPVNGVSVRVPVLSVATTSDSLGHYTIDLSPGTYNVMFDAYGYYSDTVSVVLADTSTVTRDVTLGRRPSGSLSGLVKTFVGGAPIPGASLTIPGTTALAQTGAGGTYSFPVILTGLQTLTASKFGYVPATGAVYIRQGEASTAMFSLRADVFADDVEANRGWTLGVAGDDATGGAWVRTNPNGTAGGTVQPEDDHTPAPGTTCFVTGQGVPGGSISGADVDGGKTTLLSPVLNLTGMSQPTLRLYRWYSNDAGPAPGQDTLRIDVTNNGTTWVNMETLSQTRNFWEQKTFNLWMYVTPTANMRVRIVASDYGLASVVEAAVDDIEVYDAATTTTVPTVTEPVATPGVARLALAGSPNPFPSATSLRFELPGATPVLLDIYDVSGRRVRRIVDERLEAGGHAYSWDGRDDGGHPVAAGIYMARLLTPGQGVSEKLVFEP